MFQLFYITSTFQFSIKIIIKLPKKSKIKQQTLPLLSDARKNDTPADPLTSSLFPDNSDLLAVTVTPSTKGDSQPTRQRRFLVVDVYQIVLVEPDATRLGWGVATFVGFLQDLEVVTDKEDSR